MNMEVTIAEDGRGLADNTLTLQVIRHLDQAETEALRQLLKNAFDLGYDNCRVERERQERDPAYPLHRRNPWDPAYKPCADSPCCTTLVSPERS